jgi:hypothetical protein
MKITIEREPGAATVGAMIEDGDNTAVVVREPSVSDREMVLLALDHLEEMRAIPA